MIKKKKNDKKKNDKKKIAINPGSSYPILLESEALNQIVSVEVDKNYKEEEAKAGEVYYEGKIGAHMPFSLISALKSMCGSYEHVIKNCYVQQRVNLKDQCNPDIVIGVEFKAVSTPTDKQNVVSAIGSQVCPQINIFELNGRGILYSEWNKSEQEAENWTHIFPSKV